MSLTECFEYLVRSVCIGAKCTKDIGVFVYTRVSDFIVEQDKTLGMRRMLLHLCSIIKLIYISSLYNIKIEKYGTQFNTSTNMEQRINQTKFLNPKNKDIINRKQ